jgi:hypothetical protein
MSSRGVLSLKYSRTCSSLPFPRPPHLAPMDPQTLTKSTFTCSAVDSDTTSPSILTLMLFCRALWSEWNPKKPHSYPPSPPPTPRLGLPPQQTAPQPPPVVQPLPLQPQLPSLFPGHQNPGHPNPGHQNPRQEQPGRSEVRETDPAVGVAWELWRMARPLRKPRVADP